jgi:hypothetical protein
MPQEKSKGDGQDEGGCNCIEGVGGAEVARITSSAKE